jgi:hypothetical protein
MILATAYTVALTMAGLLLAMVLGFGMLQTLWLALRKMWQEGNLMLLGRFLSACGCSAESTSCCIRSFPTASGSGHASPFFCASLCSVSSLIFRSLWRGCFGDNSHLCCSGIDQVK